MKRTLHLRKEVLAELSDAELEVMFGGSGPTLVATQCNSCSCVTCRLVGCVSGPSVNCPTIICE